MVKTKAGNLKIIHCSLFIWTAVKYDNLNYDQMSSASPLPQNNPQKSLEN